jgi:hypothetical protein
VPRRKSPQEASENGGQTHHGPRGLNQGDTLSPGQPQCKITRKKGFQKPCGDLVDIEGAMQPSNIWRDKKQ